MLKYNHNEGAKSLRTIITFFRFAVIGYGDCKSKIIISPFNRTVKMLKYNHNEGATSSKKLYINPFFSATAVTAVTAVAEKKGFMYNFLELVAPSL